MQELYVYYKLAPNQLDAARAAFEQLRAALKHQLPGLHSRLLMRPTTAAGSVQTWMEIHAWPDGHADAPGDWVEQLERQVGQLAGPSVGGRHVEVFVALA